MEILVRATVGLLILWAVNLQPEVVAVSSKAAGTAGGACFVNGTCGEKRLQCVDNVTCRIKDKQKCVIGEENNCLPDLYCQEQCVCCSESDPICRQFTDRVHGCALNVILVVANVLGAWAITFLCFYVALECC